MGKILVVDDEESIRITLKEFLQNDQHDVRVAEDAEQAIALMRKTNFDVVVTDIILPRITGVDLLKAIRKISPFSQVIMMTGKPTVDTASESLRAGAFDYLYKPVRKDAIVKAVRNAVKVKFLDDEKRRLEEENRKYHKELELLIKKRTQSLQESENRYRQLIHHSPYGIAIQQKGKIVFTNESMKKILDGISTDLFEKTILDITSSGPFQEVQQTSGAGSKIGKNVTRFTKIFSNKNSDRVHLDIVTLPLTLEQEPALQVIARDITIQKQLEESLRQSQKMEAIGTLAGGIAHDFNNILFSILGYTELSLEIVEKDSLLYSNLQEVLTAGNRAKDLVQQILTFSRQTDQELQPVRIDLIIKEALVLLRASLPTTIEIHKNIKSDAMVLADPTQIHQILMNLCINAGQAMEGKNGILTIELKSLEIDTDFSGEHPFLESGPYINLNVSDTGKGMSPEVLTCIFDPFFTTRQRTDGTGLGLSVVHGIVKSCGGAIHAFSEPGKGSTFKVYLPAVERRLNPETRDHGPIPRGNERILFVDDEPVLATMGKQLLESLGYRISTKTDSIEALDIFRKNPDNFDLVITDMTMPHMTGEKLAAELIRTRPDIPIILCTGFSRTIDDNKALALGIRAFISKPVLKREIAETIRKVLNDNIQKHT